MITFSKKPLAVVLGAAFALSGAAAHASVFQAADLGTGYMVAADAAPATTPAPAPAAPAKPHKHHKKATEQTCGGSNCEKGVKDGECVCGANKGKKADGKCGEHKCGENRTDAAAPAAGDKQAEAKCGENKCGQMKK
jgi:uncharacterized low-complexity protein